MPSRDLDRWMWAEACEMLERAERLHRQFFQPGSPPSRSRAWEPPVDMVETEHELWVIIALPGVEPKRFEVGFRAGYLVVAGVRPLPVPASGGEILRLEIPHGRFERQVELPLGRYELQRHELVNGCLYISLSKL